MSCIHWAIGRVAGSWYRPVDAVALVLEVVGVLSCLVGVALVAWATVNDSPQEEITDGLGYLAAWFGGAVLLVAGTAMVVAGAGLQAALMVFGSMTS